MLWRCGFATDGYADIMNPRKVLFDAIESSRESDTDLTDALLIGTVSVSEWIHPENGRMLVVLDSGADGCKLPPWQIMGYMQSGAAMMHHRR